MYTPTLHDCIDHLLMRKSIKVFPKKTAWIVIKKQTSSLTKITKPKPLDQFVSWSRIIWCSTMVSWFTKNFILTTKTNNNKCKKTQYPREVFVTHIFISCLEERQRLWEPLLTATKLKWYLDSATTTLEASFCNKVFQNMRPNARTRLTNMNSKRLYLCRWHI